MLKENMCQPRASIHSATLRNLSLAIALSLCTGAEAHAAADPTYAGKPFSGAPISIPGTVQAEDYDISPAAVNNVTFHYDGRIGTSEVRTTPDSIGLARFGAGHVSTTGEKQDPVGAYVGWTQTGEWWKYSLTVKQAGTYFVGGHFAAGGKGAQISFSFDSGATTGPLDIPTTAGFQPGVEVYHVWESLDKLATVSLPAGPVVMTVKIEKNAGLNLDYFTLAAAP